MARKSGRPGFSMPTPPDLRIDGRVFKGIRAVGGLFASERKPFDVFCHGGTGALRTDSPPCRFQRSGSVRICRDRASRRTFSDAGHARIDGDGVRRKKAKRRSGSRFHNGWQPASVSTARPRSVPPICLHFFLPVSIHLTNPRGGWAFRACLRGRRKSLPSRDAAEAGIA